MYISSTPSYLVDNFISKLLRVINIARVSIFKGCLTTTSVNYLIPFTNIPKLILSSFKEAKAIFSKKGSNTKVVLKELVKVEYKGYITFYPTRPNKGPKDIDG
ncbi:hypothetical protein LZ32DRAFT_623073 [Colletotrichum eremochloae]|nr:hypothetical protein LZ32DRAFT_623073 [Colletotrichum eremochloae]